MCNLQNINKIYISVVLQCHNLDSKSLFIDNKSVLVIYVQCKYFIRERIHYEMML